MALLLPIKWGLFFAGDVIGLTLFYGGDVISLALPTNVLLMDGIKPGGEEILFLVLRDSLFSSSLVLRKTVGKKKRTAEIDYEDYDSVVGCIKDYKADIVDLETKVTQLKEQGRTMKQRHKNGEFVSLSCNRKP